MLLCLFSFVNLYISLNIIFFNLSYHLKLLVKHKDYLKLTILKTLRMNKQLYL